MLQAKGVPIFPASREGAQNRFQAKALEAIFAALLSVNGLVLAALPYRVKALVPGRLLMGLLAAVILCLCAKLRKELWRTPAFYGMLLFSLASLVSMLLNNTPLKTFLAGSTWLCVFLAFWTTGSVLQQRARAFFWILGASVALMLAGYLILGQEGFGLINKSAFQKGGDRLVGGFQEMGNRLAALLAAPAFMLAAAGFDAQTRSRRLLYWLASLLLAVFLLNTATRAWVAMFFLFTALYLVRKRASWKILGIVAGVLALVLALMYLFNASQLHLYKHAVSQGSQSFLSRIPMWRVAWAGFLEHPFFGLGPDQFRVAYERHFAEHLAHLPPAERFYAIPRTTHAHNFFLSPLAEVGITGCLGLSFAVFSAMISGLRRTGAAHDAGYFLIIVLLVGMVNPSFDAQSGTILAAMIGLAASRALPNHSPR